ncbi:MULTISPECIES: hypothetical protein [Marinomonas]|uniref:Uncharacterized protein n=1 Tax=Marinomonas arctica TaxID=383750 RepID=A0A7H1J5Q4_9GAMM|nr:MULTISPECIES: hypothetical protein [Marinomonas]QNT05820.1 hypothetical protein IBG28_19600 [Marinomonas arctica]
MTKAMVFLSTRQLTQMHFSIPLFNDYDLIVIASGRELEKLPQTVADVFIHQFPIAITANDGVVIEYDEQEITRIIDSLKESSIGDRHEGCYSNLDSCAYVTCSSQNKSLIDQAFVNMSQFKPVIYAPD